MKILGYNFSKEQPKPVEKKETSSIKPADLEFAKIDLPYIKESDSNRGYVNYGDRYYTKQIMSLLDVSPLHSRIVQSKSNLVAGKEFLIDGIPSSEWIKAGDLSQSLIFTTFVNNSFNDDWYKIKRYLALDLEISGQFFLEVIWSRDFSKINSVKYHPWTSILPGVKDEEGRINSYFWKEDWYRFDEEIVEIQAFDVNSHQPEGLTEAELEEYPFDHNQIIMVKNHWPGLEYFGRPQYFGGISDITTSGSISLYNVNSVQNGFSPNILAMLRKPQSLEEEISLSRNFYKAFTGLFGKKVALFFHNEDDKPEFQPIDVKNISDQYISIKESSINSILTAHGVTAPQMFGIETPGKLGSADLDIAWSIFYNDVVSDNKSMIESVFNELISINGFDHKVQFETKKPFAV